MKKIISILLAITIMCSFTVFAFAANDKTITEGKTYTYTVSADSETNLTFVPQNSGVYKVEFAFKDLSAVKSSWISANILYDDDYISGNSICKFEDSDFELYGYNAEFYFVAEKGEKFTLNLSPSSFLSCFDTATDVTVKVEKMDVPDFEIGKTYSAASATNIYYVTPTKDTVYNITSDSLIEVEIEINDIAGAVDYIVLYEGEEINYTFKLTAGKAYAIVVYNIPEDSSFSFTVNDGSNILPTSLYVTDAYIVKGDFEWLGVQVYPYGSEINVGKLEYTVADEKIATVEYDEEYDAYTVYGHKAGTTTVTFTEPVTGVTTTATITVITKFRDFLENIPYYILSFFYRIASFFSNLF